jgi:DNA-binding LacI/PurR family transcriptional regulator
MAVWHRLARLGLAVPQAVRLAGFDGDAYGEQVGLTTAMFDPADLAAAAVAALQRHWSQDSDANREVRIPVSIRVGETS